jgi:nickel/cobalt transporter (NicO) family protein
MSAFSQLFDPSNANAWLFAPTAIALGALHGLEPGHSKTMMAAFIVAVRGTVAQATLLGLAATLSHTAVVWLVALGGLYLGASWNLEANEPLLQIVSGALIICVAAWMALRVWREAHPAQEQACPHGRHDHHHHAHAHEHATGGHAHDHHRAGADPHVGRRRETGGYAARRAAPPPPSDENVLVDLSAITDAHEREHAQEINRRFANRQVTTGQIVMFGLTGGLIPCPASITVLLLCLQIGKLALGAALVLCFSVGLALTMVAVGVGAALGVRHLSSRWSGLEAFAKRAPYFSGGVIALVGLYTIWLGASALHAP